MITKQSLKDILKENTLNVLFKKKDGTERKMLCTLNPDLLPIQENKNYSKKKIENEDVLPVWDLEEKSFRSFRIHSLIEYTVVNTTDL